MAEEVEKDKEHIDVVDFEDSSDTESHRSRWSTSSVRTAWSLVHDRNNKEGVGYRGGTSRVGAVSDFGEENNSEESVRDRSRISSVHTASEHVEASDDGESLGDRGATSSGPHTESDLDEGDMRIVSPRARLGPVPTLWSTPSFPEDESDTQSRRDTRSYSSGYTSRAIHPIGTGPTIGTGLSRPRNYFGRNHLGDDEGVDQDERVDRSTQTDVPPDTPAWIINHHRDNLVAIGVKESKRIRETSSRAASSLQHLWVRNKVRQTNAEEAPQQVVLEEVVPPPPDTNNIDPCRSRLQVSIAELQRMRLRKLQYKLICDATDMYLERGDPNGWETTLQQFVQACRDYEYMTTSLSTFTNDPFVATTEDSVVNWMMGKISKKEGDPWPDRQRAIPKSEWFDIHEKQDEFHKKWRAEARHDGGAPPVVGTRRATMEKLRLRSRQGRFLTAAFGGAFLIAPMWLMVLHKTRWTALISTTAFVVVFGIVMSASLREPEDVLSSTAAYAAVLVIFVGTTMSDS